MTRLLHDTIKLASPKQAYPFTQLLKSEIVGCTNYYYTNTIVYDSIRPVLLITMMSKQAYRCLRNTWLTNFGKLVNNYYYRVMT